MPHIHIPFVHDWVVEPTWKLLYAEIKQFNKYDFPDLNGPAILMTEIGLGNDWSKVRAYSCRTAWPNESNDTNLSDFSI